MLSANKMGIHEGRTRTLWEVSMSLQPITQRWCAIFTFLPIVLVFTVFPAFMSAQAQTSTQSLDGLWLIDGYGELIEFKGDELRSFEITRQSCIPVGKATRKSGADTDKEIVFADEGDVTRVTPGSSPDTRWLHEDGSVSSILLRRTGSTLEVCGKTLADASRNLLTVASAAIERIFKLKS
jgi:hypothetical protein